MDTLEVKIVDRLDDGCIVWTCSLVLIACCCARLYSFVLMVTMQNGMDLDKIIFMNA
jgi:hypothetical protein